MALRSSTRAEALILAALVSSSAGMAVVAGERSARAEGAAANASSPPVRVVVAIDGPLADKARQDITSALDQEGYQVVDGLPWRRELAHAGETGAIDRAHADGKKKATWVAHARAAARAAQVDAVVLVGTSLTKHGHASLDAIVIDAGATDAPTPLRTRDEHKIAGLVHDEVTRLHPKNAATAALPSTPSADPTAALPPAATTPTLARPSTASSSTSPSAPSAGPGDANANAAGDRVRGRWGSADRPLHDITREALDLTFGGGAGTRHFDYHDGLSKNLRDYHLGIAPLFSFGAAIYPFANLRAAVLPDIGVVLGYSEAVGVQSAAANQSDLGTRWTHSMVGAHWRIRTGGARAPLVGLTTAYANESFVFSSPPSVGASSTTSAGALPAVDYESLKLGADVRIPFDRFAVSADAAYLAVISGGGVSETFPHSHVKGIEASLGASVEIAHGFEARLVASYQRYFYTLDPVPGDAYVAGGALDQFWDGQAKLAYVY